MPPFTKFLRLTRSYGGVLIHSQSLVDRPTLRSVIVLSPQGWQRITRRKPNGQSPSPTTTGRPGQPYCSTDNDHGGQHVVGVIPILTARPAGLWTSSRAFRQISPSANTPADSRAKQAEVEIEQRPDFLHLSIGLSLNLPITLGDFSALWGPRLGTPI